MSSNDEIGLVFDSFDFPFRFDEKCDLALSRDESAVRNNMRLSVMIWRYGIPLTLDVGSEIPTMPFDPKDIATRELIADEAVSAIATGEPRVSVDPNARFVDDPETHKISLVLPFRFNSVNGAWKSLVLSDPDFKTIDKP